MWRKKKFIFAMATLIILIAVSIVITVYSVIVRGVVEKNTLDTISELAAHDRKTISMYVEFNWRNMERIGTRLKRTADTFETREDVFAYLNNEANESTFDNVFLVMEDGSYYTEKTYYDRNATDFYDYQSIFTEGNNHAVKLDHLPLFPEDKAVVYGSKLNQDLAGIAVDDSGKAAYAIIAVCKRASIRNGLVIESFFGDDGNARGHSAVITSQGEYIVNRTDNDESAYNWFEHIRNCENSDMTEEEVRKSLQEGEPFWFYHKDHGVREINYCVSLGTNYDWYFILTVNDEALTEQSGSFVWMIMIALSITVVIIIVGVIIIMLSQRKSEKALAKEKVQSEFLANMSHEIRTPLNGIVGLNYLMITSIDDPEKNRQVKEWLTKSHKTAKYLLSLINDILDVSKLRTGKVDVMREPMLVEPLLDAVYSMQYDNVTGKGIEYLMDIKVDYPCVLSDEVRLKQVLMNMISNAAKFTPAGGKIKLTVRQEKTDDTHVLTTFICEDTGCGMSKEFQSQIFDAFTQDRNSIQHSTKGTGLGMTISKMIVNALGGDITVESELGKGSKFTVTVPAQISDFPEYIESNVDEETERLSEELNSEERPLKILVAEDNDLNAEILVEILEEEGFAVERAENGKIAVDLFSASATDEYDVILMDMRMPEMDGCEATKTIRGLEREDAKRVLVFACTANTFNEDRIKAYESGMNDFLTKPLDVKLLFQKMEAAGKERRGNAKKG